ncbi:Histone-lysine N-methyltransferase ASHH3 [Zea mays]|nr:Histone-lysine N-methyltransferase ASHH3 [Zea mays]
MYIALRDALKIMAFLVTVSLLLVHQLCVAETAIVGKFPNFMLFSCCSSQCECDDTCTNKSFQHRPLKKTKLIKTEKCGHGLVAEDEIKKGEFVIEYVGEVIDDRTCENRLWTMKRLLDTDFYLCEVSSNMVIDATNKGNRSRFINHSCEPNTAMQKWTVDGETRVGIFALRDIKIGEELTYDYKYVGCWIIDFDQETKMHTLKFNDLHTEKFNLKEEEWHFLEVDFDED